MRILPYIAVLMLGPLCYAAQWQDAHHAPPMAAHSTVLTDTPA